MFFVTYILIWLSCAAVSIFGLYVTNGNMLCLAIMLLPLCVKMKQGNDDESEEEK